MDIGRDYAHVTKIYPFRDAPDQGIDVLFWPLPIDSDHVPYDNPFVLRNWDRLEQEAPPVLGTRYDKKVYYTGPLPDVQPGTPTGTADEWRNGLLYSKYVAGEYSTNCLEWVMPNYVVDVYSPGSTLTVSPHDGHVLADINLGHSNTWVATQEFQANVHIDASAFTNYLAFNITGNVGAGPADVLQVISNGQTLMLGAARVNGVGGVTAQALYLRCGHNQDGLRVFLPGASTSIPLSLEKGGGAVQFQVGYNGELLTNQGYAASSPGSVVAAFPIYDQDGNLLGYVPVYDSIS